MGTPTLLHPAGSSGPISRLASLRNAILENGVPRAAWRGESTRLGRRPLHGNGVVMREFLELLELFPRFA